MVDNPGRIIRDLLIIAKQLIFTNNNYAVFISKAF
jgi:hypothetical protein